MTSTLRRSAVLDRLITPWAAWIIGILIAFVETILAIAKTCPYALASARRQLPASQAVALSVELGAVSPDDGEDRDMVRHDQSCLAHHVSELLLADIATAPAVDQAPGAKT